MSIGDSLVRARLRAGLTVTQVSQRTRIRETIIRDIEGDDYSSCGGDFYARGHIRSIAKVVGTDAGPLIEEYDRARRAQEEVTETEVPGPRAFGDLPERDAGRGRDLLDWLGGPETPEDTGGPDTGGPDTGGPDTGGPDTGGPDTGGPEGRRPHGRAALALGAAAVVAVVLALGFLGYRVLPGASPSPGATPTAGNRASTTPGRQSTSRAAAASHKVVVRITALRSCRVRFTTPGGSSLSRSRVPAGVSESWTFKRAVDMRVCTPSRIRLTVNGSDPVSSDSPSHPITLHLRPGSPATVLHPPATAAASQALVPASASAFGPGGGGQGDNPQLAHLAIDGSSATAWHTDWYTTPSFGNLYQGTGLLVDMGRTVTITSARITLGSAPGTDLELRVGTAPSSAHLSTVAHATGAHGTVTLRPASPASGRYVLIWITRLPPRAAGGFQASVYNVSLMGRP